MGNPISSLIFSARNTDKFQNGDIGRLPVAIGQANNVLLAAKDIQNPLGMAIRTTGDVFEQVSKSEKLLEYAGKGVNFVSKHINPFICVAGGVKVLTAEDKGSALIEETASLGAMFTGEHFLKKYAEQIHQNTGINKLAKAFDAQFLKSKPKLKGKFGKVLEGVLFVTGSIISYAAGNKVGKLATSNIKTEALAKAAEGKSLETVYREKEEAA